MTTRRGEGEIVFQEGGIGNEQFTTYALLLLDEDFIFAYGLKCKLWGTRFMF